MLAEELQEQTIRMSSEAARALEQELTCLPGEQVLFRSATFNVVCARADQIPNLLFEIGRLRQMSLGLERPNVRRQVDLDRFDLYYTHLLLHDNRTKKIVGACRIGHADRILKRFGKDGLYTGSLFRLKDRFLKQVETGIEVSKFFLCEGYRGFRLPLLILLHGVGSEAARDPRRTIVFGPLTIDESCPTLLKRMMFACPADHPRTITFTAFIPYRGRGNRRPAPIADRDGIPIVLNHCIRLGGKMVTPDPASSAKSGFQGLIMIDLLRCDHRLLRRCMGRRAYSELITYHQKNGRNLMS